MRSHRCRRNISSTRRQAAGQAHLSDHELIDIEILDARLKGFQAEINGQLECLAGWEGGLAPAPSVEVLIAQDHNHREVWKMRSH